MHLAYLFIAESNEAFGKQIVGFRSEAGVLLEEAKWPGNLSQLRKTVQNCVLEAQGVYIEKADAERVLSRLNEEEREDIDLSGTLEEIEKGSFKNLCRRREQSNKNSGKARHQQNDALEKIEIVTLIRHRLNRCFIFCFNMQQ